MPKSIIKKIEQFGMCNTQPNTLNFANKKWNSV